MMMYYTLMMKTMTDLTHKLLSAILEKLVIKETLGLTEAANLFCKLGYSFDLQRLADGIIEVYPLDGNFYITEFIGY